MRYCIITIWNIEFQIHYYGINDIEKVNIENVQNENTSKYNVIFENDNPDSNLLSKIKEGKKVIFTSNDNVIKIHMESFRIKYTIEVNGKEYNVYSKEKGTIRHLSIYSGNVQIAEVLKSNYRTGRMCSNPFIFAWWI